MEEKKNDKVASETTSTPTAQKEETITIKKETLWKYSTFVLAAVIIVGLFVMYNGGSPTGAVVGAPTPAPSAPTPAPAAAEVQVDTEGAYKLGSDDAKVKIVEYSDFECPFCGRAQPTIQQIKDTYGDDVQLIFKDFPLSFHPNAQKAAEAARCAGDQGQFWEYHDILFANQQALNDANYKQWAGDLGLNTADFNNCLDNGVHAAAVQDDFREGQGDGVRGTPAFFVNGKLVSGAQPFSAFKQIIDAELA